MNSWLEQSEVAPQADDIKVSSDEASGGASINHVKASLFNHLTSIGEARTWSSYGFLLNNSPTPGLHLEDGDVVGLPLSSHDALRIKRQASQSSVPNKKDDGLGYELDPGQFEVRNPAWHAFVRTVGSNAIKPFDIGTVHLTLRKLVLCDRSSGSAVKEEYVQADVSKSNALIKFAALDRAKI